MFFDVDCVFARNDRFSMDNVIAFCRLNIAEYRLIRAQPLYSRWNGFSHKTKNEADHRRAYVIRTFHHTALQ